MKNTASNIEEVQDYIEKNMGNPADPKFVMNTLFPLIKIPSITTGNRYHMAEMYRCVKMLKNTFINAVYTDKNEAKKLEEEINPIWTTYDKPETIWEDNNKTIYTSEYKKYAKESKSIKSKLLDNDKIKIEIIELEEEYNAPPLIFVEKKINDKAPTVLVYGHYDVMPVTGEDGKIEKGWTVATDPFSPVIKDDKIWARGADDDKGQSSMQIAAFEALVKSEYLEKLNCNVKFLLEGQEEIGSNGLTKWCEKALNLEKFKEESEKDPESKEKEEIYKEAEEISKRLKADTILVSDTSLLGKNDPSLTCGLRGVSSVFVRVTGPAKDLHSGLFGGAVSNPLVVLSKMIASAIDENGHITIPGFYTHVYDFTEKERKEINEAPFNETDFKKNVFGDKYKTKELAGETGYTTMERKGIRPTFDVCWISGGNSGSNIVPSKAEAKISTRLVKNQNHEKICTLVKTYFESMAGPNTVEVEITGSSSGLYYSANRDSIAYKSAEKALRKTYEKGEKDLIIPYYSGGSIPIIAVLEKACGKEVPAVLLGFGLDEDAIHSPNENFPLDNLYKGIKTITYFYDYFVKDIIKK